MKMLANVLSRKTSSSQIALADMEKSEAHPDFRQ